MSIHNFGALFRPSAIALVGASNGHGSVGCVLAENLYDASFIGRIMSVKRLVEVLVEEGRKPESIFDFVHGITAVTPDKTNQDARLDLEGRAKKLLDRAA